MLATSATLYWESFVGTIRGLPLQLFFAFSQKTYGEKDAGGSLFFQ